MKKVGGGGYHHVEKLCPHMTGCSKELSQVSPQPFLEQPQCFFHSAWDVRKESSDSCCFTTFNFKSREMKPIRYMIDVIYVSNIFFKIITGFTELYGLYVFYGNQLLSFKSPIVLCFP